MFLDYFALGVLIVVALILFYAIIAIHDIPYEVSVRRIIRIRMRSRPRAG